MKPKDHKAMEEMCFCDIEGRKIAKKYCGTGQNV